MLQHGSTLDQPYTKWKKGKHILHISIYMKYLEAESRLVVLRSGSGCIEGKWQGADCKPQCFFRWWANVLKYVVMDAQLCECTKTHCIAHFKIVYVMVCEFHFF